MVQREPALAGLEPAERGDVQGRALGDLGEGQALLGPQLAQAAPDARVNALGVLAVCPHGNGACQTARRPAGRYVVPLIRQ